ncbi:aminoglycoside adenylyltransferase domain-containing protein [Nocardia sp. NPDC052316]|uniref:aminoglycoside adenylyltransferase domain-containing protein n=1 Tax=Nocardia sp. NPDC052316 TaxID=3364329 RepID=UPI0037CB6E3A
MALVDPAAVPAEVRPYLTDLVRRAHQTCGARLRSAFAVGSIALADYRHGRSDIDVILVVDPSLPGSAIHELAEVLAHPALPCPAAGLELVVYDATFAARPSAAAGYLLDLNTGPLLSNRASFDPARSSAFWYVIDRSIAYQSGCLLYGSQVRQVLAPPAPRDLFAALLASVREHATGKGHLSDNQVLNGCRSVAFCRTGRWLAKSEAAQLIMAAEADFQVLIDAALRSFQRPRTAAVPLPAADVQTFLTWVRGEVEKAVTER